MASMVVKCDQELAVVELREHDSVDSSDQKGAIDHSTPQESGLTAEQTRL